MMRWKLAIFDWDGTLADTGEAAYLSVCAQFRTYGCEPPSKKVYLESINLKHKAFYHEHGIPETATREELNKLFMDGIEANIHLIKLRSHAREFLLECQKHAIPTVIVSGVSPERYVQKGIEVLGLTGLITHVRACATTKIPELLEVCKRFGVEPQQSFYVDDSFQGVSAANIVGAFSIAIEGGFFEARELMRANPAMHISCFSELIPAFLQTGEAMQKAAG